MGDMDAFLQAHAGETRIMLAEDNPINMKVCGWVGLGWGMGWE